MIGRENEIKELNRRYNSNKAEFVALYGRRRVGKTYLVNELFKDRITFRHSGVSPIDISNENALDVQLKQFYLSLQLHGIPASRCPSNWADAFFMLEKWLQSVDDGTRQVVFLDEMPWMDTPKSGFISAFESFWNGWGSSRSNLMVIVCGSANSWIQDKLINNYGGLYNRITCQIKLSSFTLHECEQYCLDKGLEFSQYDIVQCYMMMGGIPYYMDYLKNDLSLTQNVDDIFFAKNAPLKSEFDRLYDSIFANPVMARQIVEFLGTKRIGYTRKEITERLGLTSGGNVTKVLDALVESDFAIKYIPFGEGKRQAKYKLTDPFCLFYLSFIKNKNQVNADFWKSSIDSQSVVVWKGIAFENVCFRHIDQIKSALKIRGVRTKESAWNRQGDKDNAGAQVDLLIERNDNVVNMCEIKFYSDEFKVDKAYDLVVKRRHNALKEMISPKVSVYNTLITTYGLRKNEYSDVFVNVITLDNLFDY